MRTGLIVSLAAIGVFGLAAIHRVHSLKKAGAQIVPITLARLHAISNQGPQIALAVSLQNPTHTSLTIRQPRIVLKRNGAVVGTTTPADQFITIEPRTTTTLPTQILQLSWLGPAAALVGAVAGQPLGKGWEIEVRTAVRILGLAPEQILIA